MVPELHLRAVLLVEYPAPLISAQDASADLGLYGLGVERIQLLNLDESHPMFWIGLEYAVDDADMEVSMQVERGAEGSRS